MKKKHSNVAAGTGIHEKIKQDGWSITFNVIERNEIEQQKWFPYRVTELINQQLLDSWPGVL